MTTAKAPKNVHLIKDNKITKFSKILKKNSILKHLFYEEATFKKCCYFTLSPLKKYKKYGYLPLAPLTKKSKKYGIWPLPPLIKKYKKYGFFPSPHPPLWNNSILSFFLILPLEGGHIFSSLKL